MYISHNRVTTLGTTENYKFITRGNVGLYWCSSQHVCTRSIEIDDNLLLLMLDVHVEGIH